MKISEALKALGSAQDELPEEALRWSLENWDVASTAFMQVLARCAAKLEEATDADVNIALFALHLMAQKREVRAFPLVCALAQSPEGLAAILGDTMAWTGSAILISLFDGDAKALRSIIEPPCADGLLGVCAFEAMAFLTAQGKIPRTDTREFLIRLHEESEDYLDLEALWDAWAMTVAILGFDDLMPRVRAAYKRIAVADDVGDISDIEDLLRLSLEDPMAGFSREDVGPIDDAMEALHRIADESGEAEEGGDISNDAAGSRNETPAAKNAFREVGRNDPCPCGSGKKFKKCCYAA